MCTTLNASMCTYFGYVLKIETGRDTFCVQEHIVNVWLAIVARTPWLHLVGETATGRSLQSPPRSDWAPRGGLYNHSTVRHSAGFSQWVLCSWHFTGKWSSLHTWLISDLDLWCITQLSYGSAWTLAKPIKSLLAEWCLWK